MAKSRYVVFLAAAAAFVGIIHAAHSAQPAPGRASRLFVSAGPSCTPAQLAARRACYADAHRKANFCEGFTGNTRERCRDSIAQELKFCLDPSGCPNPAS